MAPARKRTRADRLGIGANPRRNLAIQENALPDLEIKWAPNPIAVIAPTVAVLRKDALNSVWSE
jgi:hypothetical protein